MRIRLKESVAGPHYSFHIGEEADVRDDWAIELLRVGFAELIESAEISIETASVSAPEVAARKRGRPRKMG
jgi:hypothetical protein